MQWPFILYPSPLGHTPLLSISRRAAPLGILYPQNHRVLGPCPLCVWLISFSMEPLRFTHAVAWLERPTFLRLRFHCTYQTPFVPLCSPDEHLSCFHLLTTVNNAAVKLLCMNLFDSLILTLLSTQGEVGLLGHMVTVCLILWGTPKCFLHCFTFLLDMHKRLISLHPCQHVIFVFFEVIAIVAYEAVSHCVFGLAFSYLLGKPSIFRCFLAICVPSFVPVLYPLLNWVDFLVIELYLFIGPGYSLLDGHILSYKDYFCFPHLN